MSWPLARMVSVMPPAPGLVGTNNSPLAGDAHQEQRRREDSGAIMPVSLHGSEVRTPADLRFAPAQSTYYRPPRTTAQTSAILAAACGTGC